MRIAKIILLLLAAIALMVAGGIFADTQNAAFLETVRAAKAELQAGVNAWSVDRLQKARDMVIGLQLKSDPPVPYLVYLIGLADYRLAVFYMDSQNPEAGRFVSEGRSYLEKVMETAPSFGEAFSLHGMLLGLEIALHPDQGMSLGMQSMTEIERGIEKEPANPRTHLLKGESLIYTPEAYGGGAANAIPSLAKALELFEKENVVDPLKSGWGHDECLLQLGLAYKMSNDVPKAREFLNKALRLNPDLGYAKTLLESLDKTR